MEDIIIIGGGAAGLTAAMYAGRYGLSPVVFEKLFVGGQAATTYEIDNYMGFNEGVTGPELMEKMQLHAEKFNAQIKYENIVSVSLTGDEKVVETKKGTYTAKTVLLAMGAIPRKLSIPKEDELAGRGISYCATCDGSFYKGKEVVVIGGGDTALEDAVFLSNLCSRVYLIHRRNEFRANMHLQNMVKRNDKITIITPATISRILGENAVEGIVINKNGEEETLNVSGIFVAVGTVPQTELVKNEITLDASGYIITNENMETNIKGVFAAGDIIKKPLRQVITAAADGAVAAYSMAKYIDEQK